MINELRVMKNPTACTSGPGKFEGEPDYVQVYWNAVLEGGADEELDNGDESSIGVLLGDLDRSGLRRRSWIIGFDAPTMAEVSAAGGLAGVAWLLERDTWLDESLAFAGRE